MSKPAVRVHRNAGSKTGKAPLVRPPNFPQHEALPAPYSRLLNLDIEEDDETFERIAEELKAGNANEAAQKLIGLAHDETFYDYYLQYPNGVNFDKLERRNYTPSQAIRVLSYMGEAGRAGIEPFLPLLNSEDDYLREELPLYYGAMGEAALESLIRTLNKPSDEAGETDYLRSGAADCLTEIAEKFPEMREKIVPIIEQTLANEKNDVELNGFLICNLIDLNAIESYPIIEQAYEDDRVERHIVALADVQEHFGMPVTASLLREPSWVSRNDAMPLPPDDFPGEMEYSEPGAQPFVAAEKPGRNDPCHCGSGKKYKKCHGA